MLLITNQLGMLEHMSPCDYAVVRTALGHGAGFDSPGFRRVHMTSPLLGDAFDGLLSRRGRTLLEVYERSDEFEELYQLAEGMITWDERAILWRFQHLKTVERIIGGNSDRDQGTLSTCSETHRRPVFPRAVACPHRDHAKVCPRHRRTAADAARAANSPTPYRQSLAIAAVGSSR
jgi:tryptophan 2,3-dioxygenase